MLTEANVDWSTPKCWRKALDFDRAEIQRGRDAALRSRGVARTPLAKAVEVTEVSEGQRQK